MVARGTAGLDGSVGGVGWGRRVQEDRQVAFTQMLKPSTGLASGSSPHWLCLAWVLGARTQDLDGAMGELSH